MSDWQAGDLALCVGPVDDDDGERGMFVGRIYTVSAYFHAKTGMVLHFVEPTNFLPWSGWNPDCFVKVTPLAEDEFDREVIELMNREPVNLTSQSERTLALDGWV